MTYGRFAETGHGYDIPLRAPFFRRGYSASPRARRSLTLPRSPSRRTSNSLKRRMSHICPAHIPLVLGQIWQYFHQYLPMRLGLACADCLDRRYYRIKALGPQKLAKKLDRNPPPSAPQLYSQPSIWPNHMWGVVSRERRRRLDGAKRGYTANNSLHETSPSYT
mgnify:CR=1 FL=1